MVDRLRGAFALLDPGARRKLLLAVGSNVLIAAMEAAGLGLIFPLLLKVSSPETALAGAPAAVLGFLPERTETLAAWILVLFLGKNLLATVILRWQYRFLSTAEANISDRIANVYLQAPLQLHLQKNPAEFLRNVQSSDAVVGGFLVPFLSLIAELSVTALSLVMLVVLQPTVTLILMLGFGAALLVFQRLLRRRLERLGADLLSVRFLFIKALNEGFGAVREMIVFDRQKNFMDAVATQRAKYADIKCQQMLLSAAPRYYLETLLLIGLAVAAVAMAATREMAEVVATIGVLGAVGLRLLPSVNRILVTGQQMRTSGAVVDTICAEVESEAFRATQMVKRSAAQQGTVNERGLRLDNVTFRYMGKAKPALHNVSLHIPYGTSVGIVGASGAGKSTLADVILGLLDPEEGRVFADGADIFHDLSAWRRRLGYVPQTIYLTDDTLRRNIAFGLADDVIDEERVVRAVQQARLTELIDELPDGLDSKVGDRGVRLSGGQRQRIGIARALYHDPEILVLDEATSALDNETESEISRTIEAFMGSKTLLVIAHRLSTIKHCDRIVLMDDGAIANVGTFSQLAQDSETFARMVKMASLDRLPEVQAFLDPPT